MSKNTYTYEFFYEVKEHNMYELSNDLHESLDTITKIIDNNYGISYHEKNKNNKVYSHDTTKEELDPESRYIINVGSLGQPRDGNPDPVFVFYDSVSHIVKFFRFSYDLFLTQQKIIACGLPYILADRLRKGL